jgi:hypothetical protein
MTGSLQSNSVGVDLLVRIPVLQTYPEVTQHFMSNFIRATPPQNLFGILKAIYFYGVYAANWIDPD